MKTFLLILIDRVGLFLTGIHLKHLYLNKKKSEYLYERSLEYTFVLDNLCKSKVLDVLDIGTGTNSFASKSQCLAKICVKKLYDAILNGIPSPMSPLRWYKQHDN